MIDFRLGDAHSDYQRLARVILEPIDRKWPGVCRTIRLYRHHGADHSLGRAVNGNVIEINDYWFARPASFLRAMAAVGLTHGVPGVARWHDGAAEPDHLFIHEFGHCLQSHMGEIARRAAHIGHQHAIDDPTLAATGYALVDPDEWFAETFMAGLVGDGRAQRLRQVQELMRLIG